MIKYFIPILLLSASFSSHAVMIRTVINQFAVEGAAACIFSTGESADKVPLADQLDFLKSMRYSQTPEGDTFPKELDSALNSNFAATVQLVDKLKSEGPVDCKSVMRLIIENMKKKLHAEDMHETKDTDIYFDKALEGLRIVDHSLASQER